MAYDLVAGILSPAQKRALDRKYGKKRKSAGIPPLSFGADKPFRTVDFSWQELDYSGVQDEALRLADCSESTAARITNHMKDLLINHTLALKSGDLIKPASIDKYWENLGIAEKAIRAMRAAGSELSGFGVFKGDELVGYGIVPAPIRENASDIAHGMTALNEKGLTLRLDEPYPVPLFTSVQKVRTGPLARDVSFIWNLHASQIKDSINGRRGDRIAPQFSKRFVQQRAKYREVIAACNRVKAEPSGFSIFGIDYTSEDRATPIYIAPIGRRIWPQVASYVGDCPFAKGWRPIGVGRFYNGVTADELAYFSVRLAARGLWFLFAPESFDVFTKSEMVLVISAHCAGDAGADLLHENVEIEGDVKFVGDVI